MKRFKYIFIALLAISIASCDIDDLPNPNGSSSAGFQNASNSALQTLVTGSEDLLRQDFGFYYDVTAILGREYYFFTGSDPRYTGELLGRGESTLDNAGFYGTRPYGGRFRTINNLNILIDAANNSNLISQEEANGYLGFARTIQAYEYHLALNLQFQNGIRTDVSDVNNLGPFVSYEQALAFINGLLDEAQGNLSSAGSTFPFVLSSTMADFNTPATFLQFNRGLSARIALYQANNSDALSRLAGSFMDMSGDINAGPARFYSTAGGDFANNLFRPTNQAEAIIAHPSFFTDATPGDARLSKIALRDATATLDDLSGDYDVTVFTSLNDPIPLIRNEELILIAAEANIGIDNAAAVAAINVIRNAAGIGDYTGMVTDAALLTEVLYQRRYSLFGEGHRWVDYRRLGLLGNLPIDRPGDDVWVQMPIPVSENQ